MNDGEAIHQMHRWGKRSEQLTERMRAAFAAIKERNADEADDFDQRFAPTGPVFRVSCVGNFKWGWSILNSNNSMKSVATGFLKNTFADCVEDLQPAMCDCLDRFEAEVKGFEKMAQAFGIEEKP